MSTENESLQNNPEAMLVAGGIILPHLVPDVAQIVTESDFEDMRYGKAWTAIVKITTKGEDPDIMRVAKTMTVTPEKQQRISIWLSSLLDGYPKQSSLTNAAQRVRRRGTLRRAHVEIQSLSILIGEQLESTDGEVEDLEDRLAKLSMLVSARSEAVSHRTVFADRGKEVLQYFDALQTGPLATSIPTGIQKLDRKLGGGLRPGQLHTILGGTGSGKTALASQICDEAIRRGHRSLLFSMEVDPVDVYIRDVERHAGRSRWDLLPHNPAITKEKATEALMKSAALLLSKPGKVVYGEPMSVEGIRQAILTEQRLGKVAVVAVDHAQVALPSSDEKARMPRYLEVKNTAEGLREIARRLNVAVVLTAQLNPTPKGEKPSMSLVRESKDINNCSEVVMVIHHEKEDVGDETVISDSYIYLDKVRAGSGGRVKVVYRGSIFRFEDASGIEPALEDVSDV